MAKGPFIGASVPRREDPRLLVGRGTFVADVRLPGMLHLALVRSPMPHARVLRVDVKAARAHPGVVDAFTAEDVRAYLAPLPWHRPLPDDLAALRQSALSAERVRYVGEPLAVVVAGSRALAEDGAALVLSELDPLPPVADVEEADGPSLFDGHTNAVLEVVKETGGDVEAALGSADTLVEAVLKVQRHTSVPIETRGLVARPEPDGGVTLWGVTKMPHTIRAAIAQALGLEQDKVRVRPVDVGGGFGVRGEFYPEEILVPLAALRTGRPVAWVEDRREHLLATNHSREGVWRVRAGARSDGTLMGLEAEVTIDVGAYARPLTSVLAEQSAVNFLGPYRVPAFRARARCILTNKMGVGTVRAPGRYEATFARERLLDLLAAELGMDPVELRDRNLLRREDYPCDTGLTLFGEPVVYDSGDPCEALRTAVEVVDRGAVELARSEAEAAGRRIGFGVASFVESTGRGPFEMARVSLEEPGVVTVRVGTTSMGQGHETTLAQVAADAVEVPLERVVVEEGDPDKVDDGIGTFGSRTAVTAGSAVWLAGRELRERIREVDPEGGLPLEEVLARARERGISLDLTSEFRPPMATWSYGAQASVVQVDPDLGTVEVLRHVVVGDVGRAINPAIVVGQVQGAAVQGIGGALLEELAYSEDGQPLVTSFMDYLLPSALDIPDVEVRLLDRARTDRNPLGVKGAGEVGTIGAGAAVANAVQDALGPEGPLITALPLKPDRLVWRGQG